MNQLKVAIVGLVFGLALFFGLERLDLGQNNTVNIQTFVYPLGVLAVSLIVAAPSKTRIPFIPSLAGWIALYLALKALVFTGRPWLGGIYTFVTFTELVLIGMLVAMAHYLRKSLQEYQRAVEFVTLAHGSSKVPQLENAGELINAEMNRSRHYNRSLSIIVASLDVNSDEITAALPELVAEAQEKVMRQYLTAKLADTVRTELRRMDMVIEDPIKNRVIIVSPEVDRHGSEVLLERLNSSVSRRMGIEVRSGAATYPQMALTFDDLVNAAEAGMDLKTSLMLNENAGVAD